MVVFHNEYYEIHELNRVRVMIKVHIFCR